VRWVYGVFFRGGGVGFVGMGKWEERGGEGMDGWMDGWMTGGGVGE
jgi:hypothetical protein